MSIKTQKTQFDIKLRQSGLALNFARFKLFFLQTISKRIIILNEFEVLKKLRRAFIWKQILKVLIPKKQISTSNLLNLENHLILPTSIYFPS